MLSLVSLRGPDGLSDAFPCSGAVGVCLRKVLKILQKTLPHICPCPFSVWVLPLSLLLSYIVFIIFIS